MCRINEHPDAIRPTGIRQSVLREEQLAVLDCPVYGNAVITDLPLHEGGHGRGSDICEFCLDDIPQRRLKIQQEDGRRFAGLSNPFKLRFLVEGCRPSGNPASGADRTKANCVDACLARKAHLVLRTGNSDLCYGTRASWRTYLRRDNAGVRRSVVECSKLYPIGAFTRFIRRPNSAPQVLADG